MTTTDQLVLPGLPNLHLTAIGAPGHIEPASALAAMGTLRRIGASWRWVVGDFVLALVDRDIARIHEAWQQVAHLDIDERASLMRSVAVAWLVPYERRHAGLSWSHHEKVARLEPDDQAAWLTRAVTDGLSATALGDAIAAADHADDPGDAAPEPLWPTVRRSVIRSVEALWVQDPDAVVALRSDGTWRVMG